MRSRRTPPRTETRPPESDDGYSALFVDLYELTMAQSYLERGLCAPATFAVTVRQLPPDWGMLVAAGIARVLDFVDGFRFEPEDIDALRGTQLLSDDFLARLAGLRFTGAVRAVPEGCPIFAGEPILEVTAPLPEAQLLETCLINALQLPTLAATKAARCLGAASGRGVVDFSMRRAHGGDAAHQVARSAYLAGMAGTSNVEAGTRYGIPVVGTMAHSYILAFASEIEAFRAYAESFPDRCVLLVDTFETLGGVRNAVRVAHEMRTRGRQLRGIRLDSGDLSELARQARGILDAAGLADVQIVASGGLDEYRIAELVEAGAPIDSFGVGTGLGAPADSPTLDIVYKMVEYDGRAVAKRSPGKVSEPGSKQVWRDVRAGTARGDRLGLAGEDLDGRPLLESRVVDGKRVAADSALLESRVKHAAWLAEIPEACRRLRSPAAYPVEPSAALGALYRQGREPA